MRYSWGMTVPLHWTARDNPSPDLDELLSRTASTRPRSAKRPTPITRKPLRLTFREWAGSQVAAYRVGLVLGYVAMMYFGGQAFYAGIPTFTFTTPEGWTPVWSFAVVIGGFVAAIGSTRAGSEPVTKTIRTYNAIELSGAILLFLTLGTYAVILLFVGYGYGDPGRQSIGAGFVALGIPATVRMFWLFLRPRFQVQHTHFVVPQGYELVKKDVSSTPISTTIGETSSEGDAESAPREGV